MHNWEKDLNHSNKLFLNSVWPEIRDMCGGGSIKPVEIIHDNDIAKDLDILCGIDIWQTINGAGARGIASRVQARKNNNNWRTFTIRKSRNGNEETEYKKRKLAIDTGKFIYPYLTCQSYFADDRDLIGCGVARTVDIFNAITDKTPTRSFDNAVFYYVSYDDISGVKEV